MMRVLSLGAGVQSTTLALMAAAGEIGPMPDCAIFADTGDEPTPVYAHLAWLQSGVLPFPVHIVGKGGRLGDAQFSDKEARIPWHTGTGMGRRSCTKTWKSLVIRRAVRVLMGATPRSHLAPGAAEMWVGISLDEIFRIAPSRVQYITRRDPLIEQRMNRGDCKAWLARNGFPTPPKSSCVFCPYRSNVQWRDLKMNDPAGWDRAVEVDRRLREPEGMSMFKRETYAHRSCKPLDQVDLSTSEDRGQLNLFLNECSGMCGV